MSQALSVRYTSDDITAWLSQALPPAAKSLRIVSMGLPASGPSLLMECGVYLLGRRGGLLVLRCPRELAGDLAQASEGKASARVAAWEALAGLTGRLAQVLLAHGLFGDPSLASAQPAQSLRVWDWSASSPALEHLLLVGEHPLELRLWTDPDHA